jgi:hypothetical protein
MQLRVTFGTVAVEIYAGRQGSRAVETAGGGHMLNQPWKTRPGYIDRRAGTWGLWPVVTVSAGIVVRILVPVLSVLAIAIHGGTLRNIWNLEKTANALAVK